MILADMRTWITHCRVRLAAVGMLLVLLLSGCSADKPLNPSFPLKVVEAEHAIRSMHRNFFSRPKPARPIVIAMGYAQSSNDGWAMAWRIGSIVRSYDEDLDLLLPFSFATDTTFEECRERIIHEVNAEWPSDDPSRTVEVDVIGVSMGGLIARDAAVPREGERRLVINRLFTIATPHRGADLAAMPTWDARVIAMRANSEFLRELDQELAHNDYEIIPYVRLGDTIVGAENAAPLGWPAAWWVANRPFEAAHFDAAGDPRILVDIYRRLRGETPYTTSPPAPLPSTDWDSTTSLADCMTQDDAS